MPVLIAKSGTPALTGRSKQAKRSEALSTDTKAKVIQNKRKINHDIIETMGGRKTAKRAEITKQNSSRAQKKQLEMEDLQAMKNNTHRSASSSNAITNLQIGIVG